MGGSLSTVGEKTVVSRCDNSTPVESGKNGPPPMRRVLTVEEKMWEKVRSSMNPKVFIKNLRTRNINTKNECFCCDFIT